MKIWKLLLSMAIPAIAAAGQAKKDEDANDTGKDDLIGGALIYLSELAQWVIADSETKPAPKVPAALQNQSTVH